MTLIEQQKYTGERALFKSEYLLIKDSIFYDGESPLKESRNIQIQGSIFKWKYPLWYCKDIVVENTTLLESARSGIWYTENINIRNSIIEAPKTFRRTKGIILENTDMPSAQETLWNCPDIKLNKVNVRGDYFGFNSQDITIDDFHLTGNYAFDGVKNIEVFNSTILSKDAFWNCENVIVHDSTIIGEYIGWNSKNVTFINCTIESLQGLCYIENLRMINCKLINASLTFEYSTVDVEIINTIDSVMNPISGKIKAKEITNLIMDETKINPEHTDIVLTEKKNIYKKENVREGICSEV
ncbi:MAG: DUF3737 family protein [Coprobacillaceae bacterium]